VTLTREERDLVNVVRSDIRYLQSQTVSPKTDDELRRTSVELRKLLMHGLLINCWKLVGRSGQPTIIAPKLDVSDLPPNSFAVAGGANLGGYEISNFSMRSGPGAAITPEAMKERAESAKAALTWPFGLNEYRDSIALFVSGKKIKRGQIVNYVANKKGGAHYDPGRTRKKDEEIFAFLDHADAFGMTFGGSEQHDGLNSVYLELLAIGQHVSTSPDIIAMLKDCDAAVA